MVKRLTVDCNAVDLQIWDFGGEDRFRFILPAYCRGAHGAIFMYDITNPASLYHIDGWLMVLRSQNGRFPVIMAGTKDDLGFARKVEIREAMTVAGKYGIAEAIEVSSKTGHNVELLFEEVCHQMITQLTASHIKPAVNTPQTSVIPAAGNEIVITNHQSIPSGASTRVVAVCPPILAVPKSVNPTTPPQIGPKLETKDMSGI
jgi:small GTP-binding protein